MKAILLSVIAATLVVSGCAEMSEKAGKISETFKEAVGTKSKDSSVSTATPAASETAVSGTGSPAAPSTAPGAAGRPSTPPQAVVAVGGRRVPIASVEMDKYCSRVVAPFDLTSNIEALAALATEVATETFKPGAKAPNTHGLSKPLRERAAMMNWLPMSVEKRYGAAIHGENVKRRNLLMRDEPRGKQLYPVADQLLARVLKGVPANEYTFELYIRKSNEGNAIALPGGYLYIDSSLLVPGKASEASFALSHEVAHVLQRHETRMAQARIIDTVSLAGTAKDLLNTIRDPGQLSDALVGTAATGKGIFQRHYEGQELQADACGVRILDAAFDQVAEVDAALNAFIKSLRATQLDSAKALPVGEGQKGLRAGTNDDLLQAANSPLDRHPTTEARVANLAAMRASVAGQRSAVKR